MSTDTLARTCFYTTKTLRRHEQAMTRDVKEIAS
jgi:hypothetical protein